MIISEILEPQHATYTNDQYLTIAETIKKECSNIIAEYKKDIGVLYRETYDHGDIFKAKSRENRDPKDSSKFASRVYDIVAAYSGVKALRHNSIFTSSNVKYVRDQYGERVYVIVPTNQCDYTWSSKHIDLIIKDKMIRDVLISLDDTPDYSGANYSLIKKTVDKVINDLAKSIAAGNSPLEDYDWLAKLKDIQANGYHPSFLFFDMPFTDYGEKIRDLQREVRTPELIANNVDEEKFINKFDLRTNRTHDLTEALLSGNEVLIRGDYYAISEDLWFHTFSELLFS